MKEPEHCGEDLQDCTQIDPGKNAHNFCAVGNERLNTCETGDILGRSSCLCAIACDSGFTRSEDGKSCGATPDQADTSMWKKESCGSGKVPCAEGDTCRYDTDNECKESDDSEKQAKCKCMTCRMHAAVFPGNGQWIPGYQTCGTPARKRLARHLPEERRRSNVVQ